MDQTKQDNQHWAEALADQVVEAFPNQDEYVCAAGISPSGVVHFGNFRDVMTIVAVARAIERKGKAVKLLFSWDDFDRFRKVPAGIDPTFEEHIGKPLSAIPDPQGDSGVTYAQRFERLFEGAMQELSISLEYLYQTDLYQSGVYDKALRVAIERREDIGKMLLSRMSDKAKAAKGIDDTEYLSAYYPVAIYSEFTGKDLTEITGWDGKTLTYRCKETDQTGTVELGKDRNVKLGWKPDWGMRWKHEGVNFEPGGVDHHSPGGPFEVSAEVIREIYGGIPPISTRYGMVGLQGVAGKMSGSSGLAKSPNELLEVYTEPILKWLYLRTLPKKNFSLVFDTEIFRQYDEFDREIAAHRGEKLESARKFALEEAFPEGEVPATKLPPIPFRQLVSFGQIVQWDQTKLTELLDSLDSDYDSESIRVRQPRARNWLENHNPDQLISLLKEPNAECVKQLSGEARAQVAELREELSAKGGESIKELEKLVYAIPKDAKASEDENRKRQREFFKAIYQLLIGKDTGPRLSTFLWAVERKKVHALLEV